MNHNEDPSQEDIDRFSEVTGYCPNCGEEIRDDATQCHACGTWLNSGTLHQNPAALQFKKKFTILIIIIILIGFCWGVIKFF